MVATALIVFREVLEASLIVSIVMAATRGVPKRAMWVGTGVVAGIVGAVVVAVFAQTIADAAEGMGQEVFNASVLFAAVIMLGWHNVWMQRHGREIALRMAAMSRDVIKGGRPMYALAVVVSLAVLREGSEVVLFLYGIASAGGTTATSMLAGGIGGLAAGAAVGMAIYLGLLSLPTRHLFSVTSWMILLLAAGMAAQGAAFLVQADLLPELVQTAWDSSWLLSDRGTAGQVLHTLIGYVARPSGIQVVFYFTTIAVIGGLMLTVGRGAPVRAVSRAVAVFLLATGGVLTTVHPVHAQLKVYSPIVIGGEVELETRGTVTYDPDDAKNDERKLKHSVGAGVTDWWFAELNGEWEREPGEETVFEAYAFENIFQLFEQGRYWLDAGLYVEYERPKDHDDPEKIEYKALLQKGFGPMLNTVNLNFENQAGSNAEGGTEFGYAWQTRVRCRPQFEPGFEAYGDLGEVGGFLPSKDQQHRVGPAIFGTIAITPMTKIQYELGYLFGLTDATPDGTLRWQLEYEFIP